METYDVSSYGVIASSTLFVLKDSFPSRGEYAELAGSYPNVGGEAGNSALVLARLGLTVKMDGNWINPDDDAHFLRRVFNENRVDVSRLAFRCCEGTKEMLLVDSDSRTIFGTYARLLQEESWHYPQKSDIQKARVVSLDPFFGDAAMQVVDYARSFGKPIVTVDCQVDDPIFLSSDFAIISDEYLRHNYPDLDTPFIMREHKACCPGMVIFTFGQQEIHFGSQYGGFHSLAPYRINPVDTTGAGDSFRAGIIHGLLHGWPAGKMIGFASALAALVCQSIPGVLHSPDHDEVISFMNGID